MRTQLLSGCTCSLAGERFKKENRAYTLITNNDFDRKKAKKGA